MNVLNTLGFTCFAKGRLRAELVESKRRCQEAEGKSRGGARTDNAPVIALRSVSREAIGVRQRQTANAGSVGAGTGAECVVALKSVWSTQIPQC